MSDDDAGECIEVDVVPRASGSSARGHATAPTFRDRIQPLQELVDVLDPSFVLAGARGSGARVGAIERLHRLNAMRPRYQRAALAYVGTCRAISGVADLLVLAAGTGAGRSAPADLVALQRAANAVYAHVRTERWMIHPITQVFPDYVAAVRTAATTILDLFRDPQWARRVRAFRESSTPGTRAGDAMVLALVARVIQRGVEEVRQTDREGELVEALERSLEEDEGLWKPIVEVLVAANSLLGPSGTLVDIVVTIATRRIVDATERAWRCRELFDDTRSRLVELVGLEGEHLRDFDHALHEGDREHAAHALEEHFGGAGPRSIAALVAVLDLALKWSEMEHEPNFQHELDVLGGVVEATHVVGEAAVAAARLLGSRTALRGLSELLHATEGAVSVLTAVVTMVDGIADMAEAREIGDGVALTIGAFRYTSGALMLLGALGVPGLNIAGGLVGLGVFAAEVYRERTTPPPHRLLEALVAALRRPSPWNHQPLDEVTDMHELTVSLERAMAATSYPTVDVRMYGIPAEARGSIIVAWRSLLRGLGVPRELAEEIVIDPNGLSASVERDVERYHAALGHASSAPTH